MGTWTSQVDHKAMEEGGLGRWLTFSFTSYGLLTWRTPDNRRNYWKKLSRWKQYDALRKVGSCHSCGCHFDTYHLPEHCFDEFKVLPWPSHFPDLSPIKHKQIRSMQALCLWRFSVRPYLVTCRTQTVLVPDTTAHLQGSRGVHYLTGQSKKGTNTILGGYVTPAQWM